mgnify:FL=1
MRHVGIMMVIILSFVFGGCVSQYRTVAQTEVTTTRTKSGEDTKIKRVPYISFEEVIERSPNVKSVTRMTDLKGDREPGYFNISPSDGELVFQALERSDNNSLINLWKIPTLGGTAMTRLTRKIREE